VRTLRLPFLVVSIVLVISSLGSAQSESASLSGFVTDPTGAAIVGAQVQVVDVQTNVSYQAKTNSAGLYLFSTLHPGEYRLLVASTGFKQAIRQGLTLHVQDTVSQNFKLEIGSATETVSVVADSNNIDSTDASVKTVVDQRLIEELPLNGRSFQTLFELTPGVTVAATSFAKQGQFSINGQRTDTNYFMVDGASANFGIASGIPPGQSFGGSLPALSASGGTNSLVSTEAVQEFAIQTSSYSPEFGRTPGGQISIATRSGTNEFHGSAFDYFRNDILDANDWFADNKGLPKPKERQNDFGGTVSGPLLRNRTFFFFSYEGLRLRLPSVILSDVPTLASRSTAPAVIQPYLNAYPLPNGIDHGNGLAGANYSVSSPNQLDAFSLRLDHHVNNALTLFGRYNYAPSSSASRSAGFASVNSISKGDFRTQTLTVGLSYILSSRLVDEARFNWSRSTAGSEFYLDSFGGAVPLSPSSVFPGSVNASNSQFQLGFLNGANTFLDFGPNARNRSGQLNIVDSISWQPNAHLFKFGIDYRRLTPTYGQVGYGQGNEFFGVPSALAMTVNIVALTSTAGTVNGTTSNYSIYSQDTWRLFSRLTLTYGLRWDYDPVPTAISSSGITPVVLINSSNLSALTPGPSGSSLYHSTIDNFAPRLGIAYRLHGSPNTESVIRSGVGVFYDLTNGLVGNVLNRYPFFSQVLTVAPQPFPLTPTAATPVPIGSQRPFPAIQAFPNTVREPYVYHWNVSVEQSLGSAQSLTIGYVGAAGHSLIRGVSVFPPVIPAAFKQIFLATNTGYSHYNSLQSSYRRRTVGGLSILASYTYEHSLDNASDDQGTSAPPQLVSPRSDYASSDFDIRHTMSAALDYQPRTFHLSGIASEILNGWGMNALLTARSAPPVNVTIMRPFSGGQYALRPDLISGVPLYLYGAQYAAGQSINPNAFSDPVVAGQGDFGRNVVRAFGLVQQDISIRRRFRISERIGLQAKLEAFNIFNHPNFAAPSGSLGTEASPGHIVVSSTFGATTALLNRGLTTGSAVQGAGFSPLYQIGGPRSMQAVLKLEF
jgi:hypothetical protein